LLNKQIEQAGISTQDIEFHDDGLKYLIAGYTREAGLRNLEREVGSVCRKVAMRNVMSGIQKKWQIDADTVSELLGPPKFIRDERLKEDQVGITTGLAWTQAGGEILYVETLKMKGKGGLQLTGQLGNVMKESASAAMSYARAHFEELGIDEKFFEENEIHIHLPAGAIPKDGPSAGVTLATSLISLMTGTPVRRDLAMTGELTLSGRVLPVGGIKEKCLAALTHGITRVILPIANKKDLTDIPDEFRQKMEFFFAENLDEVLSLALDRKDFARKQTARAGKKSKLPSAASAA
jgi:ATP-dependent Lon protease